LLRDRVTRSALSGAAGFGKTLLLADWVKAVAGRPTAWVSVRAARVDGANGGVTPIKPDVGPLLCPSPGS